jgi:hypothetical protein
MLESSVIPSTLNDVPFLRKKKKREHFMPIVPNKRPSRTGIAPSIIVKTSQKGKLSAHRADTAA